MAIDNTVNLSQVANQYQKNDILTKTQKYQVNPNAVDKTPDKDTVQLSSGLTTKEKVGIAAVATTIVAGALAILGRNGHLGKSVQKFLGGKAKKAAQEMGEHTHTPNAHVEPKPTVKPEPEPNVKPEPEPTVKPEPEPNVKAEQEAKAKAEQEAKAKAEQEAKAKAEQEAKVKAEQGAKLAKELEAKLAVEEAEFTQQLPNMSRSELAKIRYDLDRYRGDLHQLEKKSQKEGLTKLEQVKLDSLKRQRELVRSRENEIEKSLEKYKPTFAGNTQVSMHHGINGYNCNIREAVKARANGFKGLDEDEVKDILAAEKYAAKIDKEFAKLPPLEKDCIVYRGRAENPVIKSFNKDFEIMDNSKVGDVIIPDTGYSYTAFERSMAENWGGEGARGFNEDGSLTRNIMYEIHLPKGAKVSRNGEHGGEVVMPRGAQYIIKDKKVDKEGCMEVVLEYILPKS